MSAKPTAPPPRRPALREQAPDFTVVTAAGVPWRLHDTVAGHRLLLLFYRGHW